MSDVETTPAEDQPAPEVTPDDMISRGKGLKLDALEDGSAAAQAVEDFKDLVARQKAAGEAFEKLTDERNTAVYMLKNEHNVGFTALGELMGVTSSMALYIHERAQGKSAKQIREESMRSAEAKRQFLESDPNRKPSRTQTPEEKSFRKQQREALKAFLAEQKASGANPEVGDDEVAPEDDEG